MTDQQRLAHHGFWAAFTLASISLCIVGIYLFLYLHSATSSFESNVSSRTPLYDIDTLEAVLLARSALWKFALQSCGIIAGIAFGFLGFGLFLLGIQGDTDASGRVSGYEFQVSKMAPGSFVIAASAILVGVCATHRVELAYSPTIAPTAQSRPIADPGHTELGPSKSIDTQNR